MSRLYAHPVAASWNAREPANRAYGPEEGPAPPVRGRGGRVGLGGSAMREGGDGSGKEGAARPQAAESRERGLVGRQLKRSAPLLFLVFCVWGGDRGRLPPLVIMGVLYQTVQRSSVVPQTARATLRVT